MTRCLVLIRGHEPLQEGWRKRSFRPAGPLLNESIQVGGVRFDESYHPVRVLRRIGAGNDPPVARDRKSTRLNSSHANISYAVFCLKKKRRKSTSPIPSCLVVLHTPLPPPTSTLFPYTTLFRSAPARRVAQALLSPGRAAPQ